MGRSEELGTDLRNVYKYSKEYSGSDDLQFIEQDIFINKVPLINSLVLNDTLNDTLNDRQKQILELINENNFITAEILAEKCNISIETIKRDISELINKNKLVRKGI